MSAQGGRPHEQTLSAWLATLGSGDVCPWCGERLEAAPTPGRGGGLTARAANKPADQPALYCRECGCEVVAVDKTGQPRRVFLHDAA